MKDSLQSLPQSLGQLVQHALLRLQSQHKGLDWALAVLTISHSGEQALQAYYTHTRLLHVQYMLITHSLHTIHTTRLLHTQHMLTTHSHHAHAVRALHTIHAYYTLATKIILYAHCLLTTWTLHTYYYVDYMHFLPATLLNPPTKCSPNTLHYMHTIFIPYPHYMQTTLSLHTHYLLITLTLPAHYIHTTCSLHVYYILFTCPLHSHYTLYTHIHKPCEHCRP